jgi:hypothetical protein
MRVEINSEEICYRQSDGTERIVQRDTLRAVLIETTDQGPSVEDVWWILIDGEGHCIIPQEEGGEHLLEMLQELPGFDNDAVIAAMSSVENRIFVCWQRQ